ncbi:unnamed protein product [Leuciscus chuanchicus]
MKCMLECCKDATAGCRIQAYDKRFPNCPLIPMFVNSDIISECHSEDGATQVIERRCTVDKEAPRLLKRDLFSCNVLVVAGLRVKVCL